MIGRKVRTLVKIILGGAALLWAVGIALQTEAAQTAVARKVAGVLTEKLGSEVRFSSISLRPFDLVVIRDLAIIDQEPFEKDSQMDTIIGIDYFSANIGIRSLLKKNGIYARKVELKGVTFNLAIEPGKTPGSHSVNNLMRSFKLSKKEKSGEKKDNDIFNIGKAEISALKFRLRNYTHNFNLPPEAIRWDDICVTDFNATAHNVKLKGSSMSGKVSHATIKERSGLDITNLSGSVTVSGGIVDISNFVFQDSLQTYLAASTLKMIGPTRVYKNFTDSVIFDGEITSAFLDSRTLGYFAPRVNEMEFQCNISGKVNGPVNRLNLEKVHVEELLSGVSFTADGRITDVTSPQQTVYNNTISELKFTTPGAGKLIRNLSSRASLDLSHYAKGERLLFNGHVSGGYNKLRINGRINPSEGNIKADVTLYDIIRKDSPIRIGGKVSTEDVPAGRLAGIKALGDVSMHADFSSSIKKPFDLSIDTLRVSRLGLIGYDFTGILGAGSYKNGAVDAKLICNDPNLNFIFQGVMTPSEKTGNSVYRFFANIGYADLHAIHLDKKKISRISLEASANINRTSSGDILGRLDINGLNLEDSFGRHDAGDVSISSHNSDNISRIRLASKFADASYNGTAFISKFIADLMEIASSAQKEYSGNSYNLSLTTHDSRDVLSFFIPGAYIADGTTLNAQVDKSGDIKGNLSSDRLAWKQTFIRDVKLDITKPEQVTLKLSYDNGTSSSKGGSGNLSVSGSIDSEDGKKRISASVLPSRISLGDKVWEIGRTFITSSKNGLKINGLEVSCNNERIALDGGMIKNGADTLTLNLTEFNLDILNQLTGMQLGLNGSATGWASLTSSPEGKGILVDIHSDSTRIGDENLGTLNLRSAWVEETHGFKVRISNDYKGRRNIEAMARIIPGRKRIVADVLLDSLGAGCVKPFLSSLFPQIQGRLDGSIKAEGTFGNIDLSSKGLRLSDGRLTLGYTNVEYLADGEFDITSKGIHFPAFSLGDNHGGSALMKGSIFWNGFKNMSTDLHINVDNLEALNTTVRHNSDFYGNAFATGQVDITGPLSDLVVAVEASTAKYGQIHIPLSAGSTATKSDILTFKQKEVKTDPYEEAFNRYKEHKNRTNLTARIGIRADRGTQAFIDLAGSGSNVAARGNGEILIEAGGRKGFSINGNYTISEGSARYSVLGLMKKDVSLIEGSSIHFNGPLMDSDLNIDAIYRTKASVGVLIADTTSTSYRRNVNCGINLSGKLSNPEARFSIEIPDLDPTTQSKVESLLSTEDRIQKQFLSLLVTNSFIPEEGSGIVNSSSSIYKNVTELMSNQFNNILEKLEIPVDFGFDWQQNTAGNDIFDVAISTQLFNNRVIVNGTIGNKQYTNAGYSNDLAGDVDIEVKMDKSGELRLKLFTHSADKYSSYMDYSQRSGVGITYQREFNTIGEFFRNFFKSRKRIDKENLQKAATKMKEIKIKNDIR